jgi:hypothetical protein
METDEVLETMDSIQSHARCDARIQTKGMAAMNHTRDTIYLISILAVGLLLGVVLGGCGCDRYVNDSECGKLKDNHEWAVCMKAAEKCAYYEAKR